MEYNKILKAVVVGTDHQNTLGVIRSLGEAGANVYAVIVSDRKNCSTAKSKYISNIYITRMDELVDVLVRIGEGMGERVPLIPCGDDTAIAVTTEHDKLSAHFILPKAEDSGNMLRLMKKSAMMETAKKLGLRVPEWVILCDTDFEDIDTLCARLPLPCIFKPLELKPKGTFEFHIVHNKAELLAYKDYIAENCRRVIAQEYVQKTAEFGVNACRLYHSGETVFCGVIEKKRFSQSSLGSTTAGTICADKHGLCAQAQKFVEGIDYRGIFDVEFISDGKDYFFVEMNFRNGAYGYACTKAGRNLPALWASEALGLPYQNFLASTTKDTFFINESADLQNVKAKNCSIFEWIKDVFRADAHMYINKKDMRPFFRKISGK